KTVYEGQPGDMYIAAVRDHTPGYVRDFVSRTIAFYKDQLYLRRQDGTLARIDAPDSAQKSVHKDWLVLQLREPYEAAGRSWPAGALIAAPFDAFMAGEREFVALFEPTLNSSLAGHTWTRDHLALNVMEDVKNRLSVLTPGEGGCKRSAFEGAPAFGTIDVQAVDAAFSNAVWLVSADFITPTTLSIAELG